MSKKISYATRDFAGLRNELVNLTKDYYPDLVKNFNDASIYSVLLDINAAVADNLHFHIDRVWQETMLDFAQQRQSLFHIAKTYGIRLPGVRPSVALCDFSITVDVRGDKEDVRYLGILKSGAQVSGGGQIFETIDDIDFSVPFNKKGEPNRLKIPNFNADNRLTSYTIIKREPVVNGITKIYRRVINQIDQKPFLKLYLPEQNVLGVTSVIHKDGTTFTSNPTSNEFTSTTNKWYEVKSLIQDKVFPIELYRGLNRKGEYFSIRPFDICYAYTDFPEGKKKIYRPHSPNKEGKWYTDCSQNDVGCIDSLPDEGDLLLITKAYKDCRVIRNQGVFSVWFQNEGMFPSVEIIKNLCKRFKKIIIWFDNDSAGLTNSKLLMDYINSIEPNKASTIVLPPRAQTCDNLLLF